MITPNTRMHRRRRSTIFLGGPMVVALLLAGCAVPAAETPAASEAPAATASPTPTAVADEGAAPLSEEDAIEGATAAAQSYIDIRTEIEVEHPDDSSAIDGIAGGDVADDIHSAAVESAAAGTTMSGSYAFEVTTAYASDLTAPDGTVTPFGNVSLDGCFSTEGLSATNADGSPADMSSNRRGVAQMSVSYFATESKWIVMALGTPRAENVPC
jgi:hypothetical protein